jgi:monoamine oxidase
MRGISRRDFLSAVGAAGGAGAMFATMGALGLAPTAMGGADYQPPRLSDFRLTGRAAAKVVVLGAGIAGLASAYELGKAGYDCTVLEARDVAAGRNITVRVPQPLVGDRLPDLRRHHRDRPRP